MKDERSRLTGCQWMKDGKEVVLQSAKEGQSLRDNIWFHLLLASMLRYMHIQLWMSVTRFHCLVKKYKIQTDGVTFEQKDRERHWDNYIILQFLFAACTVAAMAPGKSLLQSPSNKNILPLWSGRSIFSVLLLHAGPTEFLYYWGHRALHHNPTLFKDYHAHHHATTVTEATSGFMLTFAEHLAMAGLVSIPLVGASFLGAATVGMFYFYWLFLDFLIAMGHCNWEFVPTFIFKLFPFLKYFISTPTYHSLHHDSHMSHNTNFALSIPLYDHLGGTYDKSTPSLHATVRKGRIEKPDFVFLVHEIGLDSVLHLPMSFIGFHSTPFQHRWFVALFMPLSVPLMLLMWFFGTPFLGFQYHLHHLHSQLWVMPRFGFQYFLPFGKESINNLIEQAILNADKMGVKVLALGALNKMEELNEGGTLFLKRQPNLRMRICHGNTLTAGVILNGLPKHVTEIFLTGATSKLGRAVSLYLACRGVKVLMLTSSHTRFEAIRKECPEEFRHNLVKASSYMDAQHCKTWVLGKWASAKDQAWAPAGTKFHQFVVPTVDEVRTKDCCYGALAAMKLPKDVKGLDCCEHTLPRRVVHACHAGGLVHTLEGWTHHELGPIPIDRINVVWKAALKHGFQPVEEEAEGLLGFLHQPDIIPAHQQEM
ncbi:unnamed protein product [Sphagnum troendelagicum]|uniref:Fatty acid hydroxylase domain-containing protein n=1 Tax=Sphagnum troendelagicum TaxID=128251 RepID=A0ABP0ULQ1_9BRYO